MDTLKIITQFTGYIIKLLKAFKTVLILTYIFLKIYLY